MHETRLKWFCLCILWLHVLAIAAQSLPLPLAFPSYTENFENNNTYPAVCFNEAWQDSIGRLWLRTCSPVATDRLLLFQFDGYEFRLVSEMLDSLDPLADIKAKLGEDVYLASSQDNHITHVYRIDLRRHHILSHSWSGDNALGPVVDKDGNIRVLSIFPDGLVSHTIHDTTNIATHVPIPPPSFRELNEQPKENIYYDGSELWYYQPNRHAIMRLFLETGVIENITLSPSLSGLHINNITDAVRIGERFFLVLKASTGEFIGEFDNQHLQITLAPWPSAPCHSARVYGDDSGNILYSIVRRDDQREARLEDHDGQWIDYSAFVRAVRVGRIQNVVGKDFTNEFVICHDRGIVLQKVAVREAIHHVLEGNSIRAMTQIDKDNVLVTAQSTGPFVLHFPDLRVTLIPSPCDGIYRRFTDKINGQRWAATHKGLYATTDDFTSCQPVITEYGAVSLVEKTSDTSLVFVTQEGLINTFVPASGRLHTLLQNKQPLRVTGRLHDTYYDAKGILWVASSTGLWKVPLDERKVDTIGAALPFHDSRILCIDPDDQGRLWLGTVVGGIHIYNPETGNVSILDNERGLANNTVVTIKTDPEGVRWAATYAGISLISPEGKVISNLGPEDGLVDKENNRYASYLAANGMMLIGGVEGLNIIDPQKVKARFRANSGIRLFLSYVSYEKPGGKMADLHWFADLDQIKKITLPAGKRDLHVAFALSDYFNAENHQFEYRLRGRDEKWRALGNRHQIDLEDLSAGEYTLEIRGTNAQGIPAVNELAIVIFAKAFWYEQWWFYAFCTLGIAGLVLLWISRLRAEVKHATKEIRRDKEIIEQQAEELKSLDKAKSKFFTNISHEFRTPLTIISGMASQIIDAPQLWAEKGGQLIKDSSTNLLNLVNQILDLRKLEASTLQLDLIHADVIPYLRYLVESFSHLAAQEHKQLRLTTQVDHLEMDYDPEKLMRIISNLISNAIKYTRKEDSIDVIVSRKENAPFDQLIIHVQDTGPGISPEQLPHIFDRYYQATPSHANTSGTGIGLALTKELINLMDGTITAESKTDIGTTFLVSLPIRHEAISSTPQIPERPDHSNAFQDDKPEMDEPGEDTACILVVEDHPDVLKVILACLQPHYRTLTARDGQEGISVALEEIPDLIISDVMMPVKDGFELCAFLKQDTRTDHIPIVLLTARTDSESKLSGLAHGADDYLAKPFEPRELLSRIENLLTSRHKLQERYLRRIREQDPRPSPAIGVQDIFMQRLQKAIEDHIEDERFEVVHLCRLMTLGRTQLHQKIKALTGLSTTGYIRLVRLEKARELLQSTAMNVSEAAYAVGFSDPGYFSKLYQEMFGEPPSRTRK